MAEKDSGSGVSRRRFLALSGAGMVAGASGPLLYSSPAAALTTNARIVIVGAGAAGLSLASRFSRALRGASITVIDARERHVYQPGLTLVATGIWQPDKVLDSNARYLPDGVTWLRDNVQAYEPDQNRVRTVSGEVVEYDFLVVATGLQVNYAAIDGMRPELIGEHGIACVYDNPEHATASARVIDDFARQGGVGLFTRAPGAIKCAGAPLKVALLTENNLRDGGGRANAELHYLPPGGGLFSQPDINEFLKSHMPDDRGFRMDWHHRLVAIEPENRRAVFATPEGDRSMDYDMIHVVPPMSAPDALRNSPLAAGPGEFEGWLEVDPYSMRHRRYPNVFGAGDVVGTPIGKTAASVKAQVPVVVANLLSVLREQPLNARYNGYTSCPLITEKGRAILVEFDYELKMVPSFPFISPYREHWVPWLMKDRMLQAAYNAMLRGRV